MNVHMISVSTWLPTFSFLVRDVCDKIGTCEINSTKEIPNSFRQGFPNFMSLQTTSTFQVTLAHHYLVLYWYNSIILS